MNPNIARLVPSSTHDLPSRTTRVGAKWFRAKDQVLAGLIDTKRVVDAVDPHAGELMLHDIAMSIAMTLTRDQIAVVRDVLSDVDVPYAQVAGQR